MDGNGRPRLQRSASERGSHQRSSSLLWRVPWSSNREDYPSSGEDELPAPLSPVISQEEAKRARKQKLQRLFKQGVSKVFRERAEEMDRLAKKGSLYVMDAFAGRLQHGMAAMSTKPWYIYMGFRLQISSWWMWTIIVASIAHSLLVFLEPPPGKPPEEGWLAPRTLLVLEATFITVYAMDVALKISYMGLKSYVKKPWQKLMILIVLLLAVDASGVVGVRFARALRPAILSLRTRSIRRFYAVVSQMLPGFVRVCIPVVFFLLLSASYAALSFGRAKSDFEDPTAAGYAIWILMVCSDNYETLVNDPSTHPAYVPFIAMVIVVGSMFLLSLLLGVTYDVFIEHTTEQVKQERMKELKGLNVAFATMDPTGTGKLSMVVWERFLLHLKPKTSQQERALYFEIASSFGDSLDVLGFMDLRNVLSYSFVNVNALERHDKRKKWEKMPPTLARLLERMEAMLAEKSWKVLVAVVVVVDCCILPLSIPYQGPSPLLTRLAAMCGAILLVDQAFQLAEWMHQGSGPGPLRLPRGKTLGKSLHTKIAGVGVILHTLVVALLHCPPLLSLVCYCSSSVRGAVFGSPEAPYAGGVESGAEGETWGVCSADEAFAEREEVLGVFNGGGGREGMCMEVDWCTDAVLMLAYTLRLVRCWRLVTLSDTLHDHVNTFFSVVPVFAQTLSFALIIAYAFAMVAMQAFAGKATAFSDAGASIRTTLQLFVGVDFSAVVEETVAEAGLGALVFFVTYHVVGVLIVFNLLTAIMIQLYGEALNEKSRQGVEEQRRADQDLQDSLYEHNQKQRVLRLWGKRVTQGAAKLNITRETKVSSGREARRMLGAGGKSQVLTAEELAECQKYAKVDLLRALRERERADNNLRTFERTFYKKIKSAGAEAFNVEEFTDGDMIFVRGDQHSSCYFVHKGVVRLEYADGTIQTKETGEMFGEEGLVMNLSTSATAIAEGPVSCVGIDRATFTEEYGTLENLGMVFLRLQRSGSFNVADAPPSDCSRDGSRRSGFGGSAFSGRSARALSGMQGAGGSSRGSFSHLDSFNPADLQLPERWKNRGRNGGGNGGAGGGAPGGGSSRRNFVVDQPGWAGDGSGSGIGDRWRGGGGAGAMERPGSARTFKMSSGQSWRLDAKSGASGGGGGSNSSRSGGGGGGAAGGGGGKEGGTSSGRAGGVKSNASNKDGRSAVPAASSTSSSATPDPASAVPETITPALAATQQAPLKRPADDKGVEDGDDVPPATPPLKNIASGDGGGRAALLQRGRGSMGGFAVENSVDSAEEDVGVSSSPCPPVLGEVQRRDDDPAQIEGTGGGRELREDEKKSGCTPCCSPSNGNNLHSSFSSAPSRAIAATVSPNSSNASDDRLPMRDLALETAAAAAAAAAAGGGGGGGGGGKKAKDVDGRDPETNAGLGGMLQRAVLEDGGSTQELNVSNGETDSCGDSVQASSALPQGASDEKIDNDIVAAGAAGADGVVGAERSLLVSPSAAPRFRQQHMLQARSSFAKVADDHEGSVSASRALLSAARVSPSWSASPPSPVLSAASKDE